MATVVIAGCGRLGNELGRRCVARGDTVYGITRSSTCAVGIHTVHCDLSQNIDNTCLPQHIDLLVYCVSADSYAEAAYQHAYINCLSNLLAACAGQITIKRLVFISSTSVYGQSQGEIVDEQSPALATSFAGLILLRAESLVRNSGIDFIILRASGIYGYLPSRFLDAVCKGESVLSSSTQWSNRIHLHDLARTILYVTVMAAPEHLYIVSDPMPAPRNEILQWLQQQLNAPALDTATQPSAHKNKRCLPTRLQAANFVFEFPSYVEGFTPLLEQLK